MPRQRQRRQAPAPRAPRIPKGEKVVREGSWFSTDHPAARWYQLVEAPGQRGQLRVRVADTPNDAAAHEVVVVFAADGRLVLPAALATDPEAARIIGTALRAAARRS